MKLDLSKLTAHVQKNVGQVGQRGQLVMARISVSPSRAESEGTKRDTTKTVDKLTALTSTAEAICPTLSPALPPAGNSGKPNDCRVPPVSPVVPLEFTESRPSVQYLCQLLEINYALVQKHNIFDDHDLLLYRTGKRSVHWMIAYLVSWQLGGYGMTFGLCADAVITSHLNKLAKSSASKKAAVAMWWINREAGNED